MNDHHKSKTGFSKQSKKQNLFREFYEAHHEMGYRFIRAQRFPENNIQDILSRSFELAWDRFDEYLDTENKEYWFFNIVRNKVRYEQRKSKKSRVIRFPERHADYHETLSPGPAEEYLNSERQSYLKQIINEMPENYQMVVKLRLEGYQYSQISGMLGITVKAAQHRMKRAMIQMEPILRQFAQDYLLDG